MVDVKTAEFLSRDHGDCNDFERHKLRLEFITYVGHFHERALFCGSLYFCSPENVQEPLSVRHPIPSTPNSAALT